MACACDLIVGGSVDDLDAEIDRRLGKRSDVERQVQASRSRTRAGEAASGDHPPIRRSRPW